MNVTPKRSILASLALILVSGAIQPPNLQATAISTLVLTENSSTSLTVTLDGTGLTVTPIIGGNDWEVTLPSGDSFTHPPNVSWHEPDTTLSTNDFLPELNGSRFEVLSEGPLPVSGIINGNGAQVTITNGLQTMSGVQDLIVQFTDNGDAAAAVPEPSTLSDIILTALVSVMVFRRKLRTLLRSGC
jgi:hypothetical protein